MDNKDLIRLLTKLEILCARYIERRTVIRFECHRDLDRLLTNNLIGTYGEAIEKLYKAISEFCEDNTYLMGQISFLKESFKLSKISELRFGLDSKKKFNDEENELEVYREKQLSFYTGDMDTIKRTCIILGLKEDTLKKACQKEKLLNTKKVGREWHVNLRECMKYWNIILKEDGFYNNSIY